MFIVTIDSLAAEDCQIIFIEEHEACNDFHIIILAVYSECEALVSRPRNIHHITVWFGRACPIGNRTEIRE